MPGTAVHLNWKATEVSYGGRADEFAHLKGEVLQAALERTLGRVPGEAGASKSRVSGASASRVSGQGKAKGTA